MIKSFKGEHRWLSNFARCVVSLDGVKYPSTENAYQAAKTLILKDRVPLQSMTAGQAKRTGRKLEIRSDWDKVKLKIMFNLNKQKYDTEPYNAQLLATGDEEIEEGNTWNDTFWGVCDGVGENNLGKIIMQIRQDLCSQLKESKNA